jgi:hypothetical protein
MDLQTAMDTGLRSANEESGAHHQNCCKGPETEQELSDSGMKNADTMIVTLTIADLREVIKDELKSFQGSNGHSTSKREWLKAEELAAEYGLPKTWFEERGRGGEIARCKPGRYVLFKRRDVEAYLDQHRKVERNE